MYSFHLFICVCMLSYWKHKNVAYVKVWNSKTIGSHLGVEEGGLRTLELTVDPYRGVVGLYLNQMGGAHGD